MSRMATVPAQSRLPGQGPSAWSTAAWAVAALAVSVLLGLLGGLLWGEAAPRALLEEVGKGTAQLVNAETRAFITADAWYCGIAILAGLLTGLAGYRFGVAPRAGAARAVVAAALIAGAVAGAFTMMWLGGHVGLAAYNHALAASRAGTTFSASLALGAKSALAFWPLFTSVVLVVAEWSRQAPPPGPGPGDLAG